MDQVIRKKYVLGFMFSKNYEYVALIEKQKPVWQKGLLNGIGGKINTYEKDIPGLGVGTFHENSTDAMVREFFEETGVMTVPDEWQSFCEMQGPDFYVYCYTARRDDDDRLFFKSSEEGLVQWMPVSEVRERKREIIPNLQWLIPMAMEQNDIEVFVKYFEFNEAHNESKRPERPDNGLGGQDAGDGSGG